MDTLISSPHKYFYKSWELSCRYIKGKNDMACSPLLQMQHSLNCHMKENLRTFFLGAIYTSQGYIIQTKWEKCKDRTKDGYIGAISTRNKKGTPYNLANFSHHAARKNTRPHHKQVQPTTKATDFKHLLRRWTQTDAVYLAGKVTTTSQLQAI